MHNDVRFFEGGQAGCPGLPACSSVLKIYAPSAFPRSASRSTDAAPVKPNTGDEVPYFPASYRIPSCSYAKTSFCKLLYRPQEVTFDSATTPPKGQRCSPQVEAIVPRRVHALAAGQWALSLEMTHDPVWKPGQQQTKSRAISIRAHVLICTRGRTEDFRPHKRHPLPLHIQRVWKFGNDSPRALNFRTG